MLPNLDDGSVLVTGGTGSFGKQCVAAILAKTSARRVIVFSRDELKQYEMAQWLGRHHDDDRLRFFIGDVRDLGRLEMAFREVDHVVHAAALKQVPTAEYNPFECIHTNVIGSENVVRAAIRNGVKQVVALSTDKAASPINLYGASKLASDKIFVAANNLSGSVGTRFSVVLYGNVIGSRGSVVPLFKRLIAEGVERLPITDARMTRFWIDLQQGVDFVLSCFQSMQGGEIFVPKIPSMKITDLATAMAPELPHEIVGIRPGEKVHEVLITPDDARSTLELEDRYIVAPAFAFWAGNKALHENAMPVSEDFSYTSDANSEWLQADELLRLIQGADENGESLPKP